MNPNNWFTVFSFCAIATVLSVSYGWLVEKEKLPSNSTMGYSEAQFRFIKIWARIAALIGIIVPIIMWLVFWNEPTVRIFFSCYLVAVVVQLASEICFSRAFCKSVVVIIGTLYTGFRIWQLWWGLHSLAYSQPWQALLWLVFIFWVANIIMLITMAIPSIFPRSNNYSLGEKKTD